MKRPVAVRGVAISPISTKIGVEPSSNAGMAFLRDGLRAIIRNHGIPTCIIFGFGF